MRRGSGQNLASSKPGPVLGSQRIVLGQHARLERDPLCVVFMIMCVVMSMSMRVA